MRQAWAAAVVLAGCGAHASSVPTRSRLNDAIHLVEVREDGTSVDVPPGGIVEVDINSRIAVHVDPGALAALVGDTQADQAELDRLSKLTAQQVAVANQLAKLGADVNEANIAAWEPEVNDLGSKELALAGSLETYGRSVGLDVDNTPDLAQLVDARRRAVLERMAAASGVALRLQAALGDGGRLVHLDNYDDIAPERCALVDKLSPGKSAGEIQQQFGAAAELAKQLQDLSHAGGQVAQYAREYAASLVRQLKDAALSDATTLATLAGEVKAVIERSKPAKELAKELGREIELLQAAVGGFADACRPVADAVAKGELPSLDEAIGCGVAFAAALADKGPDLVGHAVNAAKAAKDLVSAVEAAGAAAKKELEKLAPDLEMVQRMGELASQTSAKWSNLAAFFNHAKDVPSGTFASDQQTDVPLDKAKDTSIDLTCTTRKTGDYLRFRPSLMRGAATIEVGTTDTFRVVRNGPHLEVSAAVMFLERPNNDRWDFKAAPGVVAALHHHDPRAAGKAHGNTPWNALDPGLGIHFAYPDFGGDDGGTNPSFELGVGGTVLLFGDLFQAGYGFDIQAGVPYWYIGFGLDSLAHLGVSYGLPSH